METPSSSVPGKSKLPGMPIFLWKSIASPSARMAYLLSGLKHSARICRPICALHPNACPGT